MSEDKGEKKSKPDEVDVLELLQRGAAGAQKGLGYCVKQLEHVAIFLAQKSLYLAAAVFAGVLVAFAWYKAEKPYYASSLMLRANVLDNSFYVNSVTALQDLEPEVLARVLNIPDSTAEQVRSIRAFYGVDVNGDGIVDDMLNYKRYIRNIRDSTYNIVPGVFYVTANVYSESCYAPLGDAILRFINGNPYVESHKQFRRYRIEQELSDVDVQLRRLDSLQLSEYQKSENGASLKLGGTRLLMASEKDRQLFHDHMFGLYGRRLNLEAEQTLYADAFVVLKRFIPLEKPVNTLMFYLKRTVPLFLLLSILGVVFARYRRDVWRLVKR